MSTTDRWKDREVLDVDWDLEKDDLTLTVTLKARITPEEFEETFTAGSKQMGNDISPYESLNGKRQSESAYGFVLKFLAEGVASEIDSLRR